MIYGAPTVAHSSVAHPSIAHPLVADPLTERTLQSNQKFCLKFHMIAYRLKVKMNAIFIGQILQFFDMNSSF